MLCEASSRDNLVLAHAFRDILKSLHLSGAEFSVISVGKNSNDWLDLANSFESYPIKVANFPQEVLKEKRKINSSAIVTFESVKQMINFCVRVELTNFYHKQFKFYMHYPSASLKDISKLPVFIPHGQHFEAFMQYQYFLIDEDDVIALHTFVKYLPQNCRTYQLVKVNEFDKQSRKWKSSKFAIEKFFDLNRCPITIEFVGLAPEFFKQCNEQGDISYHGYNYEIVKVLSAKLNFSLVIATVDYHPDIFLTSTAHNAFFPIRDLYHFTRPYIYENGYLIVPPGEHFSSYEKLILPYDQNIWLWIVMVFATVFAAIAVTSCIKKDVREYIFGTGEKSPSLSVARIFFGVSLEKIPTRNFTRLLIMFATLYCLIIRTAYQGKMFEFLQKNISKPQIGSIDEMIEQNFTFYMLYESNEYLLNTDFLKR